MQVMNLAQKNNLCAVLKRFAQNEIGMCNFDFLKRKGLFSLFLSIWSVKKRKCTPMNLECILWYVKPDWFIQSV